MSGSVYDVGGVRVSFPHCAYPSQLLFIERVIDACRRAVNAALESPTGTGKCWGSGTELLMFDGSRRAVEHIVAGDRLMGDDSTARTVQRGSVVAATAMLYRISYDRDVGLSWTCNADHILVLHAETHPRVVQETERWTIRHVVLRRGSDDASLILCEERADEQTYLTADDANTVVSGFASDFVVFECSVRDYLGRMSTAAQERCTMFQPANVHFAQTAQSLQQTMDRLMRRRVTFTELAETAWMIALWLMCGAFDGADTYYITQDGSGYHGVVQRICNWYCTLTGALLHPLITHKSLSPSGNTVCEARFTDAALADFLFRRILDEYGLSDKKDLPLSLLTDTCDVRRALLAGVFDGNGQVNGRTYELTISAGFAGIDSLIHLCRALGLSAIRSSVTRTIDGGVSLVRMTVRGDFTEISSLMTQEHKRIECSAQQRRAQSAERCSRFNIRKCARGRYHGFTVDGNGRCLLANFHVTHNVRARQRNSNRQSTTAPCATD